MKPRHLLLVLAAGLLLPGLLPAQTSGVPEFISYQGLVLDSAGAPVGTGTPVNRKVIFRVWDHPSNVLEANLIYSEEQTVTIADGKFSVLVGQGVGTTGGQFTFSETAYGPDANPSVSIANAFNGSGRYLGVTVDDGTAAVDNEIAPRQQVVSSAFSFRSKFAETLGSGAAGGNSLTQITGGSLAVSGANTTTTTINPQFLITADDITERLRIGVDSTGNGTSFLQSWKEGSGATNLLLNPNGGKVGIGTGNPFAQFQVGAGFPWASPQFQAYGGYQHIGTALTLGSFVFHAGAQNESALSFRAINNGTQGWTGTSVGIIYDVDGVGPLGQVGGGIWMHNGNVGIGTTAPTHKLTVGGNVSISTTLTVGGNVGIGTATPTQAKLVVNGAGGIDTIGNHASFTSNGSVDPQPGGPFHLNDVSIKATHAVHALYFRAVSDARIKSIKGRSDGASDLAMLTGIEITDYTHKDVIEHGNRPQKKVIGQQIQQVFPQAVSLTTEVVPDIYAKATQQDGWVQLATDLKLGDRVRLIGEKEEGIHEVLEVREGAFRTAFKPATDKVFVFGREVNDFRSVDYEAISMLNVSATQEMAKRVEAVTKENADLKARLAASELRLAEEEAAGNVRDSKLAAIEKQLSTLSVSLKNATD